MEYEEKKKKCEELAVDIYNKVNGAIDIHTLTYQIYPKVGDLKTKKPSFRTVKDWVTNVWQKNKWKSNKKEESPPLVYGIVDNNKLVYVGKTVRGLELREYEHRNSSTEVGKYLCDNPDCKFVILAIGESDYEASLIEKRMIEVCKPLLNKEGKTKKYKFELSIEGERQRYNKYIEMAEEIDDIHLFLDLWIMRQQIEFWKVEDIGMLLSGLDKLSGEDVEEVEEIE